MWITMLDILIIDSLHDFAKCYYQKDTWGKRTLDLAALGQYTGHKNSLLYADIYEAFKLHYYKQFYEKQKMLPFIGEK
jgi:hypothetical protein